jgi:signal transduction histidine kinase
MLQTETVAWESLFSAANLVAWSWSRGGNFQILMDSSALLGTDFPREQTLDQLLSHVNSRHHRLKLRDALHAAVESTGSGLDAIEFPLLTSTGEERWLECRGGKSAAFPDRLIGILTNVTNSSERYRLATEALYGQVYDLNWITGEVERSEGLNTLLGVEPDAVEKTVGYWRSRIHPDDVAQHQKRFATAVSRTKDGQITKVSTKYRVKHATSRRWIWISDQARILRKGPSIRVIGCNLSIDEIESARLKVEKLNRSLTRKDKEKDEFVATLSHELRNPLSVLTTNSYLLSIWNEESSRSEKAREAAHRIAVHTANLKRIVDNVLELSRERLDKVVLQMTAINVREEVGHAVDTCISAIQQREHHLNRGYTSADDVWIHADSARFQQIIWNLVSNAAKYTQNGGVIDVDISSDAASVSVCIRDNGPGLTPEARRKVFQRGTQVEEHKERRDGGMGLGLPLVRSLVRRHSGTIKLRSQLGKGTEVIVRFPILLDVPKSRPSDADISKSLTERRTKKILVVEDNRDAAETMMDILNEWGHDPKWVKTGPEALECVASWLPEVVLLDVNLGGMDGYEVARRLRESHGTSNLVLISVTGNAFEEDRALAKGAGCNHHLIKPVDPIELRKLLD